MKRLAILLVCMLAFSAATSADNAVINLKKIEKSRFGRNLLDTIQLQLTTSDHVDRLVSDLENIGQDLEKEQTEDQAQNDKLQAECAEDISRLNGEINDANLKIVELAGEIAENTPILEQKRQLLSEKKASLSTNEHLLQSLEEYFVQKQGEFQGEQQEHEHAQNVIRKAKEVLQGTFGVTSFLQVKKPTAQSLVSLAMHFDEHSKTQYKRKSWSSFFRILSQISSAAPIQADAGAVQKVIEIIEELFEKIAASLEIEAKAFAQVEADYQQQRDQYIEHISELQRVIGELDAEISALAHRLDQAAIQKDHQEQRSAEKTSELESRTNYCSAQQHQYEARAAERADQLDIIHQVLDIINSQLRVLKKYVSDRSE